MNDPAHRIYIDNRMESYDAYVTDTWVDAASIAAKPAPRLYQVFLDLMLAWRTTAYTAAMPAAAIKTVQASTLGYAAFVSPDASLVTFADNVLITLSRKIPELVEDRALRARLAEEIVSTAHDFRARRAAVPPQMPLQPLWDDFLTKDPFAMTVWSSQRVSYVAFYNAYEAFLIDCAKAVAGIEQLRTRQQEFKDVLRTGFGADIFDPCWAHGELNIVRLVRHALSHAGGRETADLKKQRHGIMVLDGVLQIVPDDNHRMLRRLRTAVDTLIAAAVHLPAFRVSSGGSSSNP